MKPVKHVSPGRPLSAEAPLFCLGKGTLVNVSHRAAHGWVYAATVKHGEQASDPPSEGWLVRGARGPGKVFHPRRMVYIYYFLGGFGGAKG